MIWLFCFGCPIAETAGQSLPGALASAITEANNASDNLAKLNQAATDALIGKPVTANSNWAKLAAQFTEAESEASKAPLPSKFTSTNIVAVEDLNSCAKRPPVLQTLSAYFGELRAAQISGQSAVTRMQETLSRIPKASAALAYLKRVHQKLVAVPIYGKSFEFDWLDIDAAELSLNGLNSTLTRQVRAFSADLQNLSSGISKYQSNMALISSLPCSKRGVWRGNAATEVSQFGGPPWCRYQVSMSGFVVVASTDDAGQINSSQLTGIMSEHPLAGCKGQSWGTRRQVYSGNGTLTGTALVLHFNAAPANEPKCDATFRGVLQGTRLVGTLVVHRTDMGTGNLAWTTIHKVN